MDSMMTPEPSNPPLPLETPPRSFDRYVFNAVHCDAAMHRDKLADGYGRRKNDNALRLQIQSNPQHWGYF